jgi:guanylate kinase
LNSHETLPRRGLLIILSSPSGAGKSTLARRLVAWDPAIRFSVSATTRPPRPGEQEGREYHFVSHARFADLVAEGAMLEHAEVFGNRYGSPRAPVEAALAEGRDTLFDIDWQGGQQIKNSALGADAVSVFILPPSIAALEARLNARAQDSAAVIAGRMAKARAEISHWAEYDYVLINADLEACTADLIAIVTAERLRRTRRPGLSAFVRGLDAEFAARSTAGDAPCSGPSTTAAPKSTRPPGSRPTRR